MPLLFASDLDGTLIPVEPAADADLEGAAATTEVAASDGLVEESESTFRSFASRSGRTLMYVTGRHLGLALDGIERFGLPRPHALACDVGTSLFWRRGSAWVLDDAYHELVASADAVGTHDRIRSLLEDLDGMTLQEEEKQGEFKVSYYVDLPLSPAFLREVKARLSPHIRPRLVHSHDPSTGRGLLDVLPAAVGKRTAVRFVADRLGVDDDSVIFAGDSGNDRDAILSGTRAIVVGNAPRELVRELREEAARRGIAERVYFSSAPLVRGVVEGLCHFGIGATDSEAGS